MQDSKPWLKTLTPMILFLIAEKTICDPQTSLKLGKFENEFLPLTVQFYSISIKRYQGVKQKLVCLSGVIATSESDSAVSM